MKTIQILKVLLGLSSISVVFSELDMNWEDYVKYGLDKSKAWKEDHNPPIYPDCKRKIIITEEK